MHYYNKSDTLVPQINANISINNFATYYNAKPILIIAKADIKPSSEEFFKISDLRQATEIFGEASPSNNMISIIKAIFDNTSTDIYCIPVIQYSMSEIQDIFRIVNEIKEKYIIISDNNSEQFALKLSSFVQDSSKNESECICVIAPDQSSYNPYEIIELSNKINNERVCIAYPPIRCPFTNINISHALLASLISNNKNPNSNLVAKKVNSKNPTAFKIDEADLFPIMSSGISVFESDWVNTILIRAMTTKTRNNSNKDFSLRNLNVIATLDFVTILIRNTLNSKNKILQYNNNSLTSIHSEVVSILLALKQNNIIKTFISPQISINELDKSICTVNIKFSIPSPVTSILLDINISI